MGEIALRNEEKVGLLAALVLHGALVAVLLMQAVRSEVLVFPERMTVSLATEVGLEAASPDPVAESRAAIAPTLADDPAPAPEAAQPEPAARVAPVPPPKPVTRTASAQPAPSRDRSRPDRTSPKPSPAPAKAAKKGGGSRIGDDFLEGNGASTDTADIRAPAQKIGASELASLRSAVGRQVKIKWQGRVPQGPDAEKLVTRVRFRLNPDGTLAGEPEILGETAGVTELNRNQVARHREEAVRAIKLVGQFKLPFPVPTEQNTFTLVFDRNS